MSSLVVFFHKEAENRAENLKDVLTERKMEVLQGNQGVEQERQEINDGCCGEIKGRR